MRGGRVECIRVCGERPAGVAAVLPLRVDFLGRLLFNDGEIGGSVADTDSVHGLDDSLIDEIVRRILSVAEPNRIILFGSAARGTMGRDSDIDLLVVQPGPFDQHSEYLRVRKSLRGMGYPFDILFITAERFEQSKNVIGGIAYPANKYGKVIYAAA